MPFKIELIISENKFLALQSEWNNLLDISSASNIFLTWEWISTWWQHFGKKNQLHVLVARDSSQGDLLGIAPLNIQSKKLGIILPHNALSFIGSNEVAPDHLDFITHPKFESEIKTAFIDHIKSTTHHWDVLDFYGIVENSTIINQLSHQKPLLRFFLSTNEIDVITLPDNWEEMSASLGKNLRSNLKRYDRKLKMVCPESVQYAKIEEGNNVGIVIETLLNYAVKVRQSHNEKHTLTNKNTRYFHQEIAKTFLQRDLLRLYTLTIAENIIAVLYCYSYNKTVYYYQTGYDLEWEKYGPGRQILAYSVAQAISDGAKKFDFLRGDHLYKKQWANEIEKDLCLKIAYSPKGLLIVTIHKVRKFIQRTLDFFTKK